MTIVTGTAAADVLVGTNSDDTLNGLGGADKMSGGAGNDRYFIDQAGDALLGHLRLLGQAGEPRSARRDALKHAGLGERQIVKPGVADRLQDPVFHVSVRDEQQHTEIDRGLLHIVRIPD